MQGVGSTIGSLRLQETPCRRPRAPPCAHRLIYSDDISPRNLLRLTPKPLTLSRSISTADEAEILLHLPARGMLFCHWQPAPPLGSGIR